MTDMKNKRINQIKVDEDSTVDEIVREMETCGFGAKRLGMAVDILEKMIRDKDCKVFLGIAGAIVPAGMKNLLIDMIRNGWVDVVVTTGANMTHDLVEAYGGEHLVGCEKEDDKKLHAKRINRIYDVFMPNWVYEKLEDELQPVLKDLPEKEMSSREFLYEIGKRVKHKESILKAASDKNVPIFCPAIADSGIGLQAWTFMLEHKLHVNTFIDLNEIIEIAWSAKKTGVFILGGGTPKNFILQSMQFSSSTHSYAVQVTTDRQEPGGLSGASLEEGISWGKLGEKSEYVDLISDITIVLPFIVAALKKRLKSG
ncbi:MAG: deoxyhypusine synthase [archaeon]